MKEILFTGKIPITCSNEEIPWQMKCDISKTDDTVEIRLIDTQDIFSFYVCTLTPSDFYILKREQDLIVDYEKFIPILVKLFHGISVNKLSGFFSKETNKFMFIEASEFRNIIRLELDFLKPDEIHYKRYLSDIISRMENDNVKLIKENGMLKDQCKNGDREMRNRIRYLEDELTNTKKKIERAYQENDSLQKEINRKNNEVKDKTNQIYKLEKENNNFLYDLEKLKLENCKLKNIEEKYKEIEVENENRKKDIETANEIIKKLREENTELKTKEQKQEDSLKTLRNENRRFKDEIDEIKRKLKLLDDKNKKLKEELKSKNSRIKELEHETNSVKKNLENAQNVYGHFYRKNTEEPRKTTFSESSSGYSIHPESPPR